MRLNIHLKSRSIIMKSIDFKSAVIGLLLGVCVMLVLGAGGIGTTNIGRYRIVAAGGASNNYCFVIDSATGRTWKKYRSGQKFYGIS